MIKEQSSEVKTKTAIQLLKEYTRTIGISFYAALVFTVALSVHARNEMIKNLYLNPDEQQKINEKIARQIVTQSDLTKGLFGKRYSICMQVGNLYETVGDYVNAEFAYRLSVEKATSQIYTPYLKLINVLVAQEKFDEANDILISVKDINDKNLIKFKTRSYIVMGDKYYSIGKFLSAAKSYEKSKYYYDRFDKKDKVIEKSISTRIVNSYIKTADIMVKSGLNTDAARFLKRAEKYDPKNSDIKYKLAIIYSDLDPIKSVDYFEELLSTKPQYIDYGVYGKALIKSANIADLEGEPTLAKYYRYKIHSYDVFTSQKVLYKNDVEIILDSFSVRKPWLKYRFDAMFRVKNVSNMDINRLSADFVLRNTDGEVLETVTKLLVKKANPLYSNGSVTEPVNVVFGKNIFTKKELENYVIDIYLYKNKKYKTLVMTMKIPLKSIKNN